MAPGSPACSRFGGGAAVRLIAVIGVGNSAQGKTVEELMQAGDLQGLASTNVH